MHERFTISCAKLYHLLNFTLHSKANACYKALDYRFYSLEHMEKITKHLPIDSIGHSHNSGGFHTLIIY